MERAFAVALTLEEGERENVLVALAPKLTEAMLERALNAALLLSNKREQTRVVLILISQIRQRDTLLGQMFASALSLSEEERTDVLVALVPQLPENLLKQAFDAALALKEEDTVDVLVALAPRLTGSLLNNTLNTFFRLSDEKELVRGLVALAPQLSENLLDTV